MPIYVYDVKISREDSQIQGVVSIARGKRLAEDQVKQLYPQAGKISLRHITSSKGAQAFPVGPPHTLS